MTDQKIPVSDAGDPPQRRAAWMSGDPVDDPDRSPKDNPLGLIALVGILAFLYVNAGPRYFLVVVGLIVMIFLHELGHFLTARWTGMKVTQFFLGMGPRIWSVHRGETEYGVRAIPAGAFVRIIGMNNLDPVEPEDEPRAYKNQTYWKRMVVITAGSMMHFIQAILLFVLVGSVIGRVVLPTGPWEIATISQLDTGETPAIEAGLAPGDTILAIDGVPTPQWSDIRGLVENRKGQQVTLDIRDADGSTRTAAVTLAEYTDIDGTTRGFIGIGPKLVTERVSPLDGVSMFGQVFVGTLEVIPRLLSPSTFARLGSAMFSGGGPDASTDPAASERPISVVGAVRIAGQPGFDWSFPLEILALINVSVGLINLVPLLPLDGGHAAVATYERIRSRKGKRYQMDVAKLMPLTYAVSALLAFLFISTIWLDIVNPLG